MLASTGGTMAALWLAATHPERVISLVIVNGTARVGQAEDYGFGVPDELMAGAADIEVPLTEGNVPQDIAIFAPSLAHRVGFQDWWGRAARRGASPATATAFNLVTFSADLRWCLPDVTCPTLVIARTESFANLSQHGRYLAEHIAGARFVTFPGHDLLPWAGEFDSIVDEIEEFVTGAREAHAVTRLLSTVLFTDIVDSTVRAAEVGDRQWRRRARRVRGQRGPAARPPRRDPGQDDRRRHLGPLRRAGAGGAWRAVHGGGGRAAPACSCGQGCTPARWSCVATTSAAWPSTSPRGSARWLRRVRCS